MKKHKEILVLDLPINIYTIDQKYFISLTDMLKGKDGEFFISDWLRNLIIIPTSLYYHSLFIKIANHFSK